MSVSGTSFYRSRSSMKPSRQVSRLSRRASALILRQVAPSLPILAVTGSEHADFYLNAINLLGADAALPKPFRFDQLVQAVADL
jgi:DNA-binding NarL/FixJ family response regulator